MMKKKISLFLTALLFMGGINNAYAQYEDTENYDDDDEYEIVVTDKDGEEEIIELPEAMIEDVDSLLTLYHTKAYIQQDPDCNSTSESPEFDDDTYIERLSKLPTVMEMPYNEVVRKMIDRYVNRGRRQVSYMLGLANFYMPIFEEALESYGLPLELKYLPVIESALNPKAVSRVGATGLWQFMLNTGKRYGLQVNSLVDERCDPLRASYAAAQYMRDLYKIFGDWNLVIAAYNCGPENVNKAIHRSGGSRDYWEIYPYLPSETRGYVPAFIAANYVMNYYCEHGICPMVTDLSVKSDTVLVSRNLHFEQIANVCNVDIDMLRELNPQYRRDIVNGNTEPSLVRMPIETINAFIDNEDSVYNYRADELFSKRNTVDVPEVQTPARTYTRSSNSYSRQSSRHSARGNGMSSRHRQSAKSKHRKSRSKRAASQNVTIKKGETLSSIAKKHGTTVEKLKKMNKLKGSTIQTGKKLKVK